MSNSVTIPISNAIDRARASLFRPFHLDKWIHLGFIAFLSNLGENGCAYSARFPFGGGGKPTTAPGKGVLDELAPEIDGAMRWASDHLALVLVLGATIFVFGTALGALILWLSSRGKLMFVESVIHDRWNVKEPWARLRAPAWSLFKFRFLLSLVTSIPVLGAFVVAAGVALPDLRSGVLGPGFWTGAVIVAAVLLVVALPSLLIVSLMDDFVVPAMYLRGELVGGGIRLVRDHVLRGNLPAVFAFYLMKIALGVGAGILTLLAACVTCCVVAIPYVGTVILLPLYVFWRLYSLYFLEQLAWQVFPQPAPPPWPMPPTGYYSS